MLLGLALWFASIPGSAADAPCLEELPLLSAEVAEARLSGLETVALQARIPHRADDPTWLSTAEARVIFRRDLRTFRWRAHLKLEFPSDAPYGLPFTFQGARVRAENPRFDASIDWSLACTEVGVSLFPRQSLEAELPAGLGPARKIQGLKLYLWGSRN